MQNIIELGFSPDISQEKQKIIQYLNEVYKAAQKLDGLRLELKFTNSAGDFRKVVKDLEETYKTLTQTINNYNDILKEVHQSQQKIADIEKKTAAAQKEAAQATTQQAKSVQELNTTYGSLVGNIEGSLVALRKLKGALAENQQAQQNLATSYQAGNITLADYNANLLGLEKQEKLLGQAIRQQNLYITSQTKELIAQEDSYDQLNAKLLQLERTWKSLSKAEREGEVGVNLQKEVAAARAELTKLDETIGNHQRKVGNYAGAWNGLGNSINQLTRELPAFANSLQTGFMGISNNIPILADEIKRIRLENMALKAEGKPTVSVLKQLSTAFFSWGTALSLGVTLLTVYGADIIKWIGHLFNAKKAVDEFKISTDLLNKTLKGTEFQKATSNIAELKEQVKLAKEGFLDKEAVVKNYNSTMGKTTGTVKSLAGVEAKLVKDAPAYVEMIKQKSVATAAYGAYAAKYIEYQIALQEASHNYAVELRAFNDLYKNDEKRYARNKQQALQELADRVRDAKAIQAEGDAYLKLGDKAETAAAKIATASKFNFNGDDKPGKGDKATNKALEAQKKANEARLQQQAQFNKDLSEQEFLGYAARQGFLKKYYAVQQQIIAENAQYDLQKAGLTNEQKLAIQEEANAKSLSLSSKYLSENAKLQEKANTEFKAQLAKDLEDMKSFEQKHGKEMQVLKFKQRDDEAKQELINSQSRLQDLSTQYNKEQAALTESLNKKEITQAEYAQKMLESQRKYAAEAIKLQLESAEKAAALTTDPQQFLDLQNKISGLKKAYQDFIKETHEKPSSNLRAWAEEATKEIDKIIPVVENVSGALSAINNIGYENQKTELDELAQKLDDNYAKEQENIANSTLSEEEKANKLKVLDAKHDAQKQQIEKRQKQADAEKANFDRLNSIAGIILNTARGVTSALAMFPPNIPLAISVGVIGAAQLATAVATKVPKYADGTDDHPGGPAIVGEGKHSELVITPDGKMSVANKPAFLDLPKHSQVIPLSQAFTSHLPGGQLDQILKLSNAKSNDQWDIAAWQIKMLTKAYKEANQGSKTRIQNNIKVDLGWYNYIQRNTQGL